MIRTQPVDGGRRYQVAFVVPSVPSDPDGGGAAPSVVGDFNDWEAGATPLTARDGGYAAVVTVDPGRYAFRYLSGDGHWFNDEAADTYEPGPFGSDNCILDLTEVAAAVPGARPRKPRAARKAAAKPTTA